MARLTANGIRVSKALNVLFQALARYYDFDQLGRIAFQTDVTDALTRELHSKNLSERDTLLYRHYTLALLQIRFEISRNHTRQKNFEPLENQTLQEEDFAHLFDEIHTLGSLQTLLMFAAEAKGVDSEFCLEVAKRICEELGGKLKDEHSIVDLPLNDYLTQSMQCGLQFISAMSCAGIVGITKVGNKPREISYETLIAVALNRELTKCCMSATVFFYRRKLNRYRANQTHVLRNSGQEHSGLSPFTIEISFEALRLQTFKDVAYEAMENRESSEVEGEKIPAEIDEIRRKQIFVQIPPEIDWLSKDQIQDLLEYSTDGLKNHMFEKDRKLLRLDKIVSSMCGQLYGILEFSMESFDELRRIYRSEEDRFDRTRKISVTDEFCKRVLEANFKIKLSQKVVYREFLNAHKFHYGEIRYKWNKMLADDALGRTSGPAMKQLLAGNLDFMNLA